MKQYDYLVVGSGLYGAVFAHEAHLKGKKCLVLEKRDHLGGNIYCQNRDGIKFIIMADISFIHLIKWFGTMSINLLNSIIM